MPVDMQKILESQRNADERRDAMHTVIVMTRAVMASLGPGERVSLMQAIGRGYCQACGEKEPPTCHCRNDD